MYQRRESVFKDLEFLIVGAGFAGTVLAQQIASVLKRKVILIDKRPHPGGASASGTDPETGIEYHMYGSHIFHTSFQDVWDYITRFTSFNSYRHQVFVNTQGRIYNLPVNLKTVNDFYGLNLRPDEMELFLEKEREGKKTETCSNLEEKAIRLVGEKLYRAFFCNYTTKQWGRPPRELPPDIIARLPVRTNYDCSYFSDPFQGIPRQGYQHLFSRLLDHPLISFLGGVSFQEIRSQLPPRCKIFYSGNLDELFGYRFGPLSWRSLRFEWKKVPVHDFQGTAVMNYADLEIPYTRIHEFKHYHTEQQEIFRQNKTLLCYEYPLEYHPGMEAFYPAGTPEDLKKYECYKALALREGIRPIGRLGSYRYWNMDQTIRNSLVVFRQLQKELGYD